MWTELSDVISCFPRLLALPLLILTFSIYHCCLCFSDESGAVVTGSARQKKTLTRSERAKKQVVRKTIQKEKQASSIRKSGKAVNVSSMKIIKKTIYVNSPLCDYAEKNDLSAMRKGIVNASDRVSVVNTICMNGESLLLRATKNGNYLVVKLLLENGADVNIQNNAGVAPLHIASRVDSKEMDVIFDMLMRVGEINLNLKDSEGYTPLMRAVEFEKISVIEQLVKKKADKYVKNNYGISAVDMAKKGLEGKKTDDEKVVSAHIVEILSKND